MGAVLGVSLSATRAGVVVLEGVGADARTVIRDAVAVSAAGLDVVVAAVEQAARTAASRGYSVQAVGLTSTADAEQYALDLASLLADSDIAGTEMVEPTDAAAALAEVIASSRRSQRATVSLITEEQTIAVLADDRDGVQHSAVSLHHDDDAALVSLDKLVADWQPGAVFVMVANDLVVDGFAERLERAIAPRVVALIDAELGLARGAALAAGNAALGDDIVVDVPSVPVRQRLHRADALLMAAVAVTLLVAAITIALARGALFGGDSPAQTNIGVGAAGNGAPHSGQTTPSPSSDVAPVSVAERASAVAPPVSAPAPAEPQLGAAGEAQLRKMTEPIAESAPVPVAPPVGALPPPAPVEEQAPSPVQDAIAFVEQALGIDIDNDGLIGGRAVNPEPASEHAP
ncbi:hypothetical protein [[Mycobacterium] nativiensis]|uniref:DUF7159 domain-containing protein n=1 Tax=[Mycobacterium] nativiensis TaxID=2855503 RepID=A0ABU5XXM9_9MYCO|nr:hypothetical protein [Mycolicibacter sp. MYC340]MEB3032542.1 hypothetical protein [Mycolicibacter sp. MYC340]